MEEHDINYRLGPSSIVYFGSGWIMARLLAHLLDDDQFNPVLRSLVKKVRMTFRYAPVTEYDDDEWHQIVERILVEEFERELGEFPVANRCAPPWRPSFERAYIVQRPLDVIAEL